MLLKNINEETLSWHLNKTVNFIQVLVFFYSYVKKFCIILTNILNEEALGWHMNNIAIGFVDYFPALDFI